MNFQHQRLIIIFATLFIAFVFSIIPPPLWAIWFKPAWVEMVVFFWALYLPERFNLIVAWFIGLILDVLTNIPLGEHAATLTIATYFIKKFHQQLVLFPLWQQTCVMSFILLMHQFLLFLLQYFTGQSTWLIWTPPLLNLILWPFFVNILKKSIKKSSFLSFS